MTNERRNTPRTPKDPRTVMLIKTRRTTGREPATGGVRRGHHGCFFLPMVSGVESEPRSPVMLWLWRPGFASKRREGGGPDYSDEALLSPLEG